MRRLDQLTQPATKNPLPPLTLGWSQDGGRPEPALGLTKGWGKPVVPAPAGTSRPHQGARTAHPGPVKGRGSGAGVKAGPSMSPVEFARDILGVTLWEKQEEALNALADHRRVAVKSGNGLGKGFCAAVAVLWFLHTHERAVVLTTAPTFRQVRYILWRQIHSLYHCAPEALGGKLLNTRWELDEERFAIGLSAESADQFQGFHSPHILVVVDEAAGVRDDIYEAIDSVMTSAGAKLLLIGNPTSTEGSFRRAFHEERRIYHCVTISALDSPNVQADEVIYDGLTTREWVDERKEIWGEDSELYRARVLAQFPEQSPNTLIPLSQLEAAVERWEVLNQADVTDPVLSREQAEARQAVRGDDEVVLGVDVARFGDDRSVILRRRGHQVEDIQAFRRIDNMDLAARVAADIRRHQPRQTCVDGAGLGAGVVDRLRQLGFGVHDIHGASAPRQKGNLLNLRAEGYTRLRDLFAAGRIAIPPDPQLLGELASLRYKFTEGELYRIERKEDMKKRGLPSPDKADALMLAFVLPPARPKIWT